MVYKRTPFIILVKPKEFLWKTPNATGNPSRWVSQKTLTNRFFLNNP